MAYPKISILTLKHRREEAFIHFLAGLAKSNVMPDELIVVHMNEEGTPVHGLPFPLRNLRIDADGRLPLAAARNLAAKKATGDLLIFLDIDCIPSMQLVEDYTRCFDRQSLISGEIRYLKKGTPSLQDFLHHLDHLSLPDPIRDGIDPLPYNLFWSLNFACSKSTYESIGGFDERFVGYGGEDTDFAFAAKANNIRIIQAKACAYHQHHESFSPPLNHFADIIGNANIFFKKWGLFPMEGWLDSFTQLSLIKMESDVIEIVKFPSSEQISAARKN